ncbi:hypothetical protein SY88_06205 [Clostridiales bacterium PH28_bin88]|nr:hypothetical protein SY88_06205 [Clostridiales bacterium PH28_bin88]
MVKEEGKGHPLEERIPEKVDSSGNTGHPERDQFIEGKIGSGFMSTITGQPSLDEFAREISPGPDTRNKIKPVNEKTPEPVEDHQDL